VIDPYGGEDRSWVGAVPVARTEEPMTSNDYVSIANVVAISDGLTLICEIDGRWHGIPRRTIRADSQVHEPGDRGTLVIVDWLAEARVQPRHPGVPVSPAPRSR
jgi:hypothetical protein